MKNSIRLFVIVFFSTVAVWSQNEIKQFQNPILTGFNPDPSICRVGDDYYLAVSSFGWFPGMPIYHSKDLVNWELIGHGLTRPSQLNLNGVKDEKGIWAVTIRYHEGLFYLITTCSDCGGNFYITAKDPAGEWSDPVWLKDAPGIDPSLFWDEDGTCYYTGNTWDFKKSWPGQCAVWAQKLDLSQQKLVGERKTLTYGHANNAAYAEGPHLYQIDKKYLLLMSEGGSSPNHAISAHHGDTVLGTFTADKINPVLSHRQFGEDYPVQTIGHGDLVQIPNGDWWAVVLGTRNIQNHVKLTRETFLCKVKFEDRTPIFNPGFGKVLMEQERPALPWTPVKPELQKDEFDSPVLSLKWHTVRTPKKQFYQINKGKIYLDFLPVAVDSLDHSAMLIQRIKDNRYLATAKLSFKTNKINEQAGLIMHRNNNSYYVLLKEKKRIVLIKKSGQKKNEIAYFPYDKPEVLLRVEASDLNLQFSFGSSPESMTKIGDIQDLTILAESKENKFNGPGVGMYATGNGESGNNKAVFDWFEYKTE